MRDAFWDLVTGGVCLGCRAPGRHLCPGCARDLPGPGAAFLAELDPMPPVPVLAAAAYDGAVRRMILRHKEDQAFSLAAPLAVALSSPVSVLGAAVPDGAGTVLVPVPSDRRAVRRRGHDALLRVVHGVAGTLPSGAVVAPLLRRRRGIADQGGLRAADRATNLSGALRVDPAAVRELSRRVPGPVGVIVCDDVVTTGATLNEAVRALLASGLPVTGAAVVAASRLRRGSGSLPLSERGR